jgi:hypothetical protein
LKATCKKTRKAIETLKENWLLIAALTLFAIGQFHNWTTCGKGWC